MKILCTALYPMWHYHYVTELEIIENHLDAGDDVTVLTCDGFLRACEANPEHELSRCLRCIGIRQHGVKLLSKEVKMLPLGKRYVHPEIPAHLDTLERLKAIRIEEFDAGMAAFSSLVDYSKETAPTMSKHKVHARKLLQDTADLYRTALEYLEGGAFDLVYIFNGRYAAARPWVRACEKLNICFRIHERGGKHGRYSLYENSLLHDTKKFPGLIRHCWEEASDPVMRESEARKFYEERIEGKLGTWFSFTAKQSKGELSDEFDPHANNYVMFASTEGEIASVEGIYEKLLYSSQDEAVRKISSHLAANKPDVRLTLRIHPNSASDKRRWWEEPSLVDCRNLTIIPPESSVSSYALLMASRVVISFGSTMGVEASYWGKPSILFGQAFYRGINAVYEPASFEEGWRLLENPPAPLPVEGALRFGYYFRCGGEETRYSESVNYYTLKFKGEILEARQEVHEWLGECEKRDPVTGWKKWLQKRRDKRRFNQIIKDCNGELAAAKQKI